MRAGLADLEAPVAARHVSALLAFADGTGGFRGRRGKADLYYTGFAVRALHALGQLDEAPALRTGLSAYFQRQAPLNLIDTLSFLYAALLLEQPEVPGESLLERLELMRAADGGYAQTRGGEGSTYQSFLAACCYDLCAQPLPEPERLRAFVCSRRHCDGGFGQLSTASRSSLNATAAGVALALLLGIDDEQFYRPLPGYILALQQPNGGFLAGTQAPVADLLSTYTALVTLASLLVLERDVMARALAFAGSCEKTAGGFSGGPWDANVDVEYTYYGLGVRALANQF